MKHKYNIGDVVILYKPYLNSGKAVGIILNKLNSHDSHFNVRYTILVCGDPTPMAFWEDRIEAKIE
jgi:hypothetical protein